MNMSLAHLVTLRELARRGTMVAVAEELGYTAGAVSQQIAALEKAVGSQLVTKVGRNVVLTDSGVVLAEHAVKILGAEQSALDALRAVHDDVAAPLLLGTFGSTAAALLPPVVAAAQREYPHLTLSSRELDVDEAATAVQRGQVDVAFGLDYPHSPMPRTPDIEMITLRSERFGLAVSSGAYGIRTECTIDLREAAEWDWILPPTETQFGRAIRIACRQEGFEPITRHEIVDTAVSLALAAKGLGAAPVTDMMIRLNSSVPIVRVDLAQEIGRRIVLLRLAGSETRPTVRAVTEIVRAVVNTAETR
ncbi:LysR family transcriptional regulator [Rhodococcus sp. NPDC057014]|uniref:LysR family transcriptional regulator n=1 Tax=unclassified Rhodococcus (in: high G+C Gram-positive bacteria) TaxID=192944 RepID=UPI003636F91D